MDSNLIFWYRIMTAHAEVIVLTICPYPLGFQGRGRVLCVDLRVPVIVEASVLTG